MKDWSIRAGFAFLFFISFGILYVLAGKIVWINGKFNDIEKEIAIIKAVLMERK